jgi:2-oxoglutarate ferredoxin oxidoreductase subunit delta
LAISWIPLYGIIPLRRPRERKPVMKEKKEKRRDPAEIRLNQDWCKGCYLCLEICPQKVFEKSLEVSDKGFHAVEIVHPERCTRCLLCERICPDLALDVKK